MKRSKSLLLTYAVLVSVALLMLAACAKESAPVETVQAPPQPAKILFFYPGQESVPPGDKAQFCYGVEFATSVRLEPAVEEIRPLSNKCVWFEPEKTTELTLIAAGEDGKEVSESITITVKSGSAPTTSSSRAPAPSRLIETFVATSTVIAPGGGSTICWVLSEPATLRMNPSSGPLGDDLKKCVLVRPKETTTYTLSATAGSRTDKASVTVRVE